MEIKHIKPKICIISLGGTITATGETSVDPFYSSSSLELNRILELIPNLQDIAFIQRETIANLASHEIGHDIVFLLAQHIQNLANSTDVDGVVVVQGTNSLEEIAYFIHLVVKTDKPIIFTGAIKPATALGYDGAKNLYNAIILAAAKEAYGKGVLITFNDCIVGARDAAKLNASIISDFAGNDLALLGYMHGGCACFYRAPIKKHTLYSEFEINKIKDFPTIYIVYGHLGVGSSLVNIATTDDKLQGIVSAGMGNGYQPSAMTIALAEASNKGIIVVRSARSGQGTVYRDAHTDDKYGFIAGDSLTPQKGRILLGIALTKTTNKHEIQRIFTEY